MSIEDLLRAAGQVSASRLPAAQSADSIAIPRVQLPDAQIGAVYHARVHSESSQTNETVSTSEYRLQIGTRVVTAQTDAALRTDQEIQLEVTGLGEKVELRLARNSQAQSGGRGHQPLQKLFQNVLKALDIQEDELRKLAASLSLSRNPASLVPTELSGNSSEHPVSNLLQTLITEEKILTDRTLQNKDKILQILQSSTSELQYTTAETREVLEELITSSASPKVREFIRKLSEEIEQTQLQTAASREPSALKLEKLPLNDEALQQTLRILQAIASGQADSDAPREVETRNFLSLHLTEIKDLEAKVRSALETVYRESGVSLLLSTLERYEDSPPFESNTMTREFHRFVQTLKADILETQTTPEPGKALQQTLERALSTLHEQFSADETKFSKQPLAQSTLLSFTPDSELTQEHQNALRSIHAQIQTLLRSPEVSESALQEFTSNLSSLRENLSETGQRAPQIKEFLSRIEQEITAYRGSSAPKESISDILGRALEQMSLEFSRPTAPPSETAEQSFFRSAAPRLQEVRARLESLLKESTPADAELRKLEEFLSESASTAKQRPQNSSVDTLFRDLQSPLRDAISRQHPPAQMREVLTQLLAKVEHQLETIAAHTPQASSVAGFGEAIQRLTEQISKLLQPGEVQTEQIQKLLESVSAVNKLLEFGTTPLERSLYEFTGKLQQQLESFLKNGTSKEGLRDLLKHTLQSLQENFSAENSVTSIPSSPTHFTPHPSLERTTQIALRSIEAQLSSLVQTLSDSPASSTTTPAPPQLPGAILRPLLSELESAIKQTTEIPPVNQTLQEIRNTLTTQLSQSTASPVTALEQATHALTELLQSPGKTSTPALPPPIREVISTLVKHMESALKTMQQQLPTPATHSPAGEAAPQPSPTAPYLNPSQLEFSPEVREKIDLVLRQRGAFQLANFLRNLSSGDAETTPFDQQFLQVATNLLRDLELSATKEEPVTKDVVKKASAKIQQLLEQSATQATKPGNLQKQLKALKTLEGIIRSNEMLAQMNPLLQAAGEPAFLLFPALIQGLLSSIELSFYPPTDNPKTEEDENGGGKKSELFQRFRIQLTLPSLGPIGVDIAYRTKEVYLRMDTADEKIRDFLDARFPMLERAIRGRGFDQVHLTAGVSKAGLEAPRWSQEYAKPEWVIA